VNVAEIRGKAVDDIRREIAAAEKEIWKIRFGRGSEMARMLTVLRERELEIERGAKKA
jgi:ribosomal protein L29